jgi:hypothetical protein
MISKIYYKKLVVKDFIGTTLYNENRCKLQVLAPLEVGLWLEALNVVFHNLCSFFSILGYWNIFFLKYFIKCYKEIITI